MELKHRNLEWRKELVKWEERMEMMTEFEQRGS